MGYFSNSSESCAYEAQWCDRCFHQDDPCTVWLLHLLRNYDDCENEKSALHYLIPIGKSGENLRCTMFKPKEVMKRRPVVQRPKAPEEML